MMQSHVVIIGAKRTPLGAFCGVFSSISAPQLGGHAIKHALQESPLDPQSVQTLMMGCVLPANLGQAPARQAAYHAGLPWSVPCSVISKVCGSGMESVILSMHMIRSGALQVAIAGGMENMTLAPYMIHNGRLGLRLGHKELTDHLFKDGLEDATSSTLMGRFADDTAREFNLSRDAQEEFAAESARRAFRAVEQRYVHTEIAPFLLKEEPIEIDETLGRVKVEKFSRLKPAFSKDGTVTAATSSAIADGAAALALTTEEYAREKGAVPLATIKAIGAHAHTPEHFTTAPVQAIEKALKTAGWSINDVDAFEINEAFAVVPMAAIKQLNIPREKVNLHGGACALGHPLGATGTRILVTLVNILRTHGLKRGLASLCIGGGEAVALAIERCES